MTSASEGALSGLAAPVPASSAVASFPAGTVFVFDHDLRYTHVGGEHLPVLGRDRLDYVGRTLHEMFDVAAVAVREPAYRRALSGENVVIDAPLENDRILEMHLSPLIGAKGLVTGVIGFTLDVTELRRKAESLRDSQEQFRLAFEKAPIGMALARPDGTLFQVNAALCAILGGDEQSLTGLTLDSLTHPDDTPGFLAHIQDLLDGRQDTFQAEVRYRRPATGDVLWTLLVCTLVRTAAEQPSHVIAQITDITERREAQDKIAEGQAFQMAVLSVSPDITHVREVGKTENVWTSRSTLDMLGYAPDQLAALGPALHDRLVPEADRARFDEASRAVEDVADGEVVQVQHRVLHADGSYRWMSRRLTPFRRDEHGKVTQILGVSRDVTESVAAQERLEHAARHDELTGLPNRRLVHERLAHILRSRTARAALLFCDLDGFKQVNDMHGHLAGDAVLIEVASRLLSALRDADTVGRLGGDEFVVVLSLEREQDAASVADQIASRITAALQRPLVLNGELCTLTASIGIALPEDVDSVDDVLRRADHAMYEAKAAGKNRHLTFVGTSRAAEPA